MQKMNGVDKLMEQWYNKYRRRACTGLGMGTGQKPGVGVGRENQTLKEETTEPCYNIHCADLMSVPWSCLFYNTQT